MAEWLKAHAWKACLLERVTWVRIPLSPPYSLQCGEIRVDFSGNCRKRAQFSLVLLRNRTGESILLNAEGKLCRLFLWRASERSGFDDSIQANAMRSELDSVARAT